jgi:nucleoside 2-deoxyribosyltransferase
MSGLVPPRKLKPLALLKLYLAGPEVFLPEAREIGLRKKALCEEFGFIGLYPLDNEFAAAADERLDETIFAANVAFLREADAGIFNLSPFRGVNADPGTAFELGFCAALGKPAFAYSHHGAPLFDRVAGVFGARAAETGFHRDADGLLVENFGNADNLMLDATLKSHGRAVLRPDTGVIGDDDLSLFAGCLRQAKAHFGI